jgi:PAS domain S-box-containing protein
MRSVIYSVHCIGYNPDQVAKIKEKLESDDCYTVFGYDNSTEINIINFSEKINNIFLLGSETNYENIKKSVREIREKYPDIVIIRFLFSHFRDKYPDRIRKITDRYLLKGDDPEIWSENLISVINSTHDSLIRDLKRQHNFLRTILDTVPICIACMDKEGVILIANRTFCSSLGLTPKYIEGKHLQNFFEASRYEEHNSLILKCLQGREVAFTEEVAFKGRDPELRFIRGKYSPLLDPEEGVIGVVGALVDITDFRQAHSALEKVNLKLRLLSSITRHDIINSITAVLGYLTYAEEETELKVIMPLLTKTHKVAELIQEQIEFTRDYQELGIKKPVWQNGEVVFKKAIHGLKTENIEFSITLSDLQVYADPLLERVIFNLVDNTLRYGGDVSKVSSYWGIDNNSLIWTISDNGVGVQPDMKEMIFRKGIGQHTGLGLFLSKEILDITGMKIRETGIFGEGARFDIIIPEGIWKLV